ncbi:Phage shock protein B [Raoultella planticola]|uniref:Phage shock protein B n=1 Tax=Raoultella planticola TaxID=575 RepID=A0A485AKH8_RAOPL|nr:Phage shock protein B [Raoultella planticola]
MRRRSLTVRSTHEYAFYCHTSDAVCAVRFTGLAWLHYNNRTASGSLSQNEQQRLLQLTDDAKRMRERIQTLEDILDAEHPNWRDK